MHFQRILHSYQTSKCSNTLENSLSTDDQQTFQKLEKKKIKTNLCKYKTQYCKNYSQRGYCPYKQKCQFAHGKQEIQHKIIQEEQKRQFYRTKPCQKFWNKGFCTYGTRCQFSHNENKKESEKKIFLKIASNLLCKRDQSQEINGSKLLFPY